MPRYLNKSTAADLGLPDDERISASRQNRCDGFYRPPREIASFVERLNNELDHARKYRGKPRRYVRVWSIARQVSLFDEHDSFMASMTYEVIYDDLVKALDLVHFYAARLRRR